MAEVLRIDFESGLTDSHGHTLTSSGLSFETATAISGSASAQLASDGYIRATGLAIGTQDLGIACLSRLDAAPTGYFFLLGQKDVGIGLMCWPAENPAESTISVGLNDSWRELAYVWPVGDVVHAELDKQGAIVKVFMDGALVGTIDFSDAPGGVSISATALVIGNYDHEVLDAAFPGVIDNVVMSVGAPLHTAPFTPDYGSAPSDPVGESTLPLRIVSGDIDAPALPVRIMVVSNAIYTGERGIGNAGDTTAAVWQTTVRIGGTDVSNQVISEISIEGEESASSLATLTIKPDTGSVVDAATWSGRPLEIDVADFSSGAVIRLFTGFVDVPKIDLNTRTIALTCTTDLQGRCDALSRSEILGLFSSFDVYDSPAVFDSAATGWVYAQDLLSTVQASLYITPHGDLRVAPWAAKSSPDIVIDQDRGGDQSLALDMADRSGIVNQIVIDFGYRFPRVKAECFSFGYDSETLLNFPQHRLDERVFMQRDQVRDALEAAGGTIESLTFEPLPTYPIPYGESGYWNPGPYDASLCMGFDTQVSFAYTQTIEERHRITVVNQKSVETIGVRPATMSGALEGAYPDLVAVESNIVLYRNDLSSIPPPDSAAILPGSTTSVDAQLSSETNRAAANAAMETLIAIAKARIAASHRRNRVSVTIPLVPVIDLDKTARIDAGGVLVQAKVARYRHLLNPATAEAITELSLAVSSLAGVGIVHDDDPVAAPEGTTAATSTLPDQPLVVFNSGATEDHIITVTFPEVATGARDNTAIDIPTSVAAGIPEDTFTITL